MVVIIAVPSDPRKRPKKPATELPSRGKKTISRYIRSSVFIKQKNKTMKERPVIETKTCVVKHIRHFRLDLQWSVTQDGKRVSFFRAETGPESITADFKRALLLLFGSNSTLIFKL